MKKSSKTTIQSLGPWSHGDWAKIQRMLRGNINFGDSISGFYKKNMKLIFFRHFFEKITVKAKTNYQNLHV
jgi:hypothetical protein